ncbi:hypothetical protein LUZ61_008584 [Rhynchospora tenuis]|uniref:RBR-type E3 ubiquitin transferase n=1 Tax=Rhynchospora tenuis TaxID=198213 RepID=A0AAD5ZVT5_9POAL|nr:hypothetical protein LUZ61_008584 [Rhynchospora tenuis]
MGEPSYADISDQIDDLYFNYDQTRDLIPISDENYAKELQLQEFLFSAFASSVSPDEKERKDKASSLSSQAQLVCKLCMENLPAAELFQTSNACSHVFCHDCLSRYLGSKIQENISVVICPDENCKAVLEPELCQELLPSEVFESDCLSHYLSTKIKENIPVVKCPEENCKALLELGMCRELLPSEVFERWECEVCESMVQGAQKFYCPFEDCSAFMVDDGDEIMTHAECPNCRRLFCAACKVAWHSGLSCVEYGKLGEDERGKDDLLVIQVAKEKKWRRCPSCKYYVEKKDGESYASMNEAFWDDASRVNIYDGLSLIQPFTEQEIVDALNSSAREKTPGPDGLWPVALKEQVKALLEDNLPDQLEGNDQRMYTLWRAPGIDDSGGANFG